LARKGLAKPDAAVLEAAIAIGVGFAHDVAVTVFDRRRSLRKAAAARKVTLTRCGEVDPSALCAEASGEGGSIHGWRYYPHPILR
jgi:hypothetical protein